MDRRGSFVLVLALGCVPVDPGDADPYPPADTAVVDADGDGYVAPGADVAPERTDCDDADATVTPNTVRYVPAGSFLRGSDAVAIASAAPAATVALSAYCIDVYEVDATRFAAFLTDAVAAGGYTYRDGWVYDADGAAIMDVLDTEADDAVPQYVVPDGDGFAPNPDYADHPVTEVTWAGAQAYCASVGGALPTEAQWERGARGEDGRTWPWGEDAPTCEHGNFGVVPGDQSPTCFGGTTPVGSFPAGQSPYGLHDMGGNVMEWVADHYLSGYADGAAADTTGPAFGWMYDAAWAGHDARGNRGGAWITAPDAMHTYERMADWPFRTSNSIGFRCARPVGEPPAPPETPPALDVACGFTGGATGGLSTDLDWTATRADGAGCEGAGDAQMAGMRFLDDAGGPAVVLIWEDAGAATGTFPATVAFVLGPVSIWAAEPTACTVTIATRTLLDDTVAPRWHVEGTGRCDADARPMFDPMGEPATLAPFTFSGLLYRAG